MLRFAPPVKVGETGEMVDEPPLPPEPDPPSITTSGFLSVPVRCPYLNSSTGAAACVWARAGVAIKREAASKSNRMGQHSVERIVPPARSVPWSESSTGWGMWASYIWTQCANPKPTGHRRIGLMQSMHKIKSMIQQCCIK